MSSGKSLNILNKKMVKMIKMNVKSPKNCFVDKSPLVNGQDAYAEGDAPGLSIVAGAGSQFKCFSSF